MNCWNGFNNRAYRHSSSNTRHGLLQMTKVDYKYNSPDQADDDSKHLDGNVTVNHNYTNSVALNTTDVADGNNVEASRQQQQQQQQQQLSNVLNRKIPNNERAKDDDDNDDDNDEIRLTNETSKIASYREIAIFAATTIIIWLSEPLLSLVDTTVVGKFSSVPIIAASVTRTASSISTSTSTLPIGISNNLIQLAALGPATMLCDTSIYLTYFLAIATTNQLAAASAVEDTSLQIKTTSHALGIAALLGTLIAAMIFFRGEAIIKLILGSEGAFLNGIDMTSDVASAALSYAKIRALVSPLVIMGVIAQSVSLATLDTRTPAMAVLAASVMNVLGDVLLVVVFHFGLTGAAIATAVAGSVSSLILLWEARKKVTRWKLKQRNEMESSTVRDVWEEEGGGYNATVPLATRRNDGPHRVDSGGEMNFVSFPDFMSLISLCKLAGPIFFVMVGKVICYSATSFRASDFGMLPLAAHNIMLRIFYFFCTFGDSFSQVAQSFIPAVLYGDNEACAQSSSSATTTTTSYIDDDTTGNSTESKHIGEHNHDIIKDVVLHSYVDHNKKKTTILLKKIIVLASLMAVINSTVSKVIMQKCSSFFTNDAVIQSILGVPCNVLYVTGCVLLHPFLMTFEGSILATRDLGYLVGSYGLTTGALLLLLRFRTASFPEVWRSLFLFQVIRSVLFGWRVWRKTQNNSKRV